MARKNIAKNAPAKAAPSTVAKPTKTAESVAGAGKPTGKPVKPAAAPATAASSAADKQTKTKPAKSLATASQPTARPTKPATALAAPLPKPATITIKQLAARLSEKHNVSAKQAQAMLEGVLDLLTDRLKAGDKLRLNGFGILEVRNRPARTGRNPATGETVQIAESRKIAFRPAKELKDAI